MGLDSPGLYIYSPTASLTVIVIILNSFSGFLQSLKSPWNLVVLEKSLNFEGPWKSPWILKVLEKS